MKWRLGALAATVSLCALSACHRSSSDNAAPAPEAAADIGADAEPAVLPARCHRTDTALAFDESRGLDDLEIGDAISYPGGYAVGLVHRAAAAGRVAAVALLGRDLKSVKVVDLGPTLGDAPPPRIGWRPPELVAAAYARSSGAGETARETALYTISADAATASPFVVSQERDDSLAFDLGFDSKAGLLVWDEATSASRGIVKAAVFSRDQAAASRTISPPESDAELPRVVPQGSGFVVLWIARRPEPASEVDASGAEATGEPRTFGWLEMVAVDEQGAPVGSVRRLTPPSGHVSAFDVEARSFGAAGPLLVVVARDDGEVVDGSGGALLRVRVRGDVIEPTVGFAIDGLGRGAPTFVSSANPASPFALAWVGREEQFRFLPLDGSGTPTEAPSAEDAMDEARPLLFIGASATEPLGPASLVLVATPSDAQHPLRAFACAFARGRGP
jgi:hypothetical protein